MQGTEQITSASGTAVPGMSSVCTGLEGAPGQGRSLPMLPVSMRGEEAEAVPCGREEVRQEVVKPTCSPRLAWKAALGNSTPKIMSGRW